MRGMFQEIQGEEEVSKIFRLRITYSSFYFNIHTQTPHPAHLPSSIFSGNTQLLI